VPITSGARLSRFVAKADKRVAFIAQHPNVTSFELIELLRADARAEPCMTGFIRACCQRKVMG
jgi:hypothetical protein